ncbi:MAG: ferritin-like domain-containing protein [Chloroflexi bacterium]|nr:ferritin-like domain-containing protein [Chloroflexota bacterium]
MGDLVIPAGGFQPPPPIPQPNIYPMEWRIETHRLAEIYERSKRDAWNPAVDIPWDRLDPEQYTLEQRLGIMYWYAVLANFDGSGPAVFAKATIHSFEMHEEDPVRKCFFSITRDEMNHEECCQRAIQKLVPGGPLDFPATTPLAQAAQNNIGWLYHNGGRYWKGYSESLHKYPLSVLFTSFMMGEMAASTLFSGMAKNARNPVFKEIFTRVGRDESRHLQICLTILDKDWPGLKEEHKALITRQLRAGFVFLSMVLWEPPNQFWELPDYFLANHRVLMDHARDAGLGVLSYDEQAENWRVALAKVAQLVARWGIEFPAIPELDIVGVDVSGFTAEDIIPVF